MFHLFNSVYFELNDSSENLERRLESLGVGEENELWGYLYAQQKEPSRLVFTVTGSELLRLQITFWKNILPFANLDTVYNLHLLYIEDCKFRMHLPVVSEVASAKAAYLLLRPFSRQEFSKIYESAPHIDFLKKLPKEKLSFEFQLADYFCNESSSLKHVVLDKVRHCTWVNWMAELEILKTDILNGIADINRLLPKENWIDVSDPTQLYAQAIGHPYLCWVADADFTGSNYDYVEKNYSKDIFKFLYECFYNMWQVNGEDMSELIDLIYSHQYETLLHRDVRRSFGSVYSAGRFRNRMNQVLVSTIYKYKRDGNFAALKPFTLTSPASNS